MYDPYCILFTMCEAGLIGVCHIELVGLIGVCHIGGLGLIGKLVPGTGVVEGVHDGQGARAGEAARGHVHQEEEGEVLLGVGLGEEGFDGVLEGEVERLRGEVSQHVDEVSSPEGGKTLLGVHAAEAVGDAGVSCDLSGLDQRVGVLGLDYELDTLDGGRASLGDSS
jgi:hypothetical protein